MVDGQVPERRDEQRQHEHHDSQEAQIRTHEGREVKLVGFLREVEKGRGEEHDGGGVVDHEDDIPFQNARRRAVGAFGVTDFREGVVPLFRAQGFRDALLSERDGVHVALVELLADGPE